MTWEPSDELLETCEIAAATSYFLGNERRKTWRNDVAQVSEVLKAAVDSGELVPRERLEPVSFVGQQLYRIIEPNDGGE